MAEGKIERFPLAYVYSYFFVEAFKNFDHPDYHNSRPYKDFQILEMRARDGQFYQKLPSPHVDQIK